MNRPLPEPATDKRTQRTREALLAAFFGLVLERRYGEFNVGDIVARANVGRSTFYEHFASKNAMLASSLEHPFAALADTVLVVDNTARLVSLLQHFHENRDVCRTLLASSMRQKVGAVLVRMVEQRLADERLVFPHTLLIPARLAAVQLAESLLAPIAAWLAGAAACPPELLARALRRTAVGMVDAVRNPV